MNEMKASALVGISVGAEWADADEGEPVMEKSVTPKSPILLTES